MELEDKLAVIHDELNQSSKRTFIHQAMGTVPIAPACGQWRRLSNFSGGMGYFMSWTWIYPNALIPLIMNASFRVETER